MADFRSFKALRPAPDKAALVAALPYDVVNREEAKKIGDANPYSFLHVDRAEMDLPPETDLYDPIVYQRARKNLEQMEQDGVLIQDPEKHYYIYELTRKGKVQTGFVGCSSIDDYMNGVIKKHENTRADKEQDRINHVDVCDANTGPIYLACRYPDSLLSLMNACGPVDDEWYCRACLEGAIFAASPRTAGIVAASKLGSLVLIAVVEYGTVVARYDK